MGGRSNVYAKKNPSHVFFYTTTLGGKTSNPARSWSPKRPGPSSGRVRQLANALLGSLETGKTGKRGDGYKVNFRSQSETLLVWVMYIVLFLLALKKKTGSKEMQTNKRSFILTKSATSHIWWLQMPEVWSLV